MPNAQSVFHAFTLKHTGLANRILTEVSVCQAFDPASAPSPLPHAEKAIALWDTGATASVITSSLVKTLGLVPVSTTIVKHAGGASPSNVYLVNFGLPNNVQAYGILVTECADSDFGAIIGMDIISQGDFSLTNYNGNTWLSFRVPSRHQVDFVVEANKINFAGVGRNHPCPCGQKSPNGSPLKFKNCHGK